MVDKPLEQAGLTPLLGTASSQELWKFLNYTDVVNVKNYGAVGDGVTNDTAAIQSAINAAFGTSTNPHNNNSSANKILFFPPGTYTVSSPVSAKTVLNAVPDGNPTPPYGKMQYTFSDVTGLSVGHQFYIEGIGGDGALNGTRMPSVISSNVVTTEQIYYENSINHIFTPSASVTVSSGDVYTNNNVNFSAQTTQTSSSAITLLRGQVRGSITASIASSIMTVTAAAPVYGSSNAIAVGDAVSGSSTPVANLTYVTSFGSGSGLTGTYGVSVNQTVGSEGMATYATDPAFGPGLSGTLTRVSGTGSSAITFSAQSVGGIAYTPAVIATGVRGGKIIGSGRFTTAVSGGGIPFATDGFTYSRVEGMAFSGAGATTGSKSFLHDMRGGLQGTQAFVGMQGNTFYDCFFTGAEVAFENGPTNQSQCSECLWIDCHFSNCSIGWRNGLNVNFNALQHNFVGGNFQACSNYGIHIPYGSAYHIDSVGFQVNGFDIFSANGAIDAMVMTGCRTESANFCDSQFTVPKLVGCSQASGTAGTFVFSFGPVSLDACLSQNGTVGSWSGGSIRDCQFNTTDVNHAWVSNGANANNTPIFYIENVMAGQAVTGTGADATGHWYTEGYIAFRSGDNLPQFAGVKRGNYTPGVLTLAPLTAAELPTPAAQWRGLTATIGDSSLSYVSSNIGTEISTGGGGGANTVPLFCTSTAWVIS